MMQCFPGRAALTMLNSGTTWPPASAQIASGSEWAGTSTPASGCAQSWAGVSPPPAPRSLRYQLCCKLSQDTRTVASTVWVTLREPRRAHIIVSVSACMCRCLAMNMCTTDVAIAPSALAQITSNQVKPGITLMNASLHCRANKSCAGLILGRIIFRGRRIFWGCILNQSESI